MNSVEESVTLLLEALPEIENRWAEHLEYWGDDERHPYNDLGEIANFLVYEFVAGNHEPMRRASVLIERFLGSEDKELEMAMRGSLIETIHTRYTHHFPDLSLLDLAPHLGARMLAELREEDIRWRGSSEL